MTLAPWFAFATGGATTDVRILDNQSSVAVPLVGFDAGYGIEARHWRFFLVLGA
jgi:hypothetical protein